MLEMAGKNINESFKVNSSDREDVVQYLKSTRKGRLSYGSNNNKNYSGVHQPTTKRRSVQMDGPNNSLVISLSSPPDLRNSESISNFDTTRRENVHAKLQVDKTETSKNRSKRDKDFSKTFSGQNCPGKSNKISASSECLYISRPDVLGLLKEYKTELEEKARMEVKAMKQSFLARLVEIQHEIKDADQIVSSVVYDKYISYVNELDETAMEVEGRNEEDMKKLIRNHKRRENIASMLTEMISKKQQEIVNEKIMQEKFHERMISLCKSIESGISEVREMSKHILAELAPHQNNAYIPDGIKSLTNDIKNIFANVAKIGNNAITQQENLDEAIVFIEKNISNLKVTKEKVSQEIAKAEVKMKEEEERKELEKKMLEAKAMEKKRIEEEKKKEQESKAANVVQAMPATGNLSHSTSLGLYVSPVAFEHYQVIYNFHNQIKSLLAQFLAAKEKKSFRFELTKAINTPINAISDQSPQHLMDKIERLTKLLKGDAIEVGNKRISATGDPDGLAYSQDTVAKKLVLQGAKQISSNFSSAFAFGAVALGIWSQFPDVGKLILAHFYTVCPYLVPYYIPKKEGQSTAEYCKCLGYDVDGEDVESEEKYLKKLSGIVRLYASILQSPMPPSLSKMPHPFGLHNGWTWISRIMNLEPRETVTATVIFDFLEVAGYALSVKYGKQFQKLLKILCEDMIPKIDQITTPDNKGPVVRLKIFLEKCMKSSSFPVPEGRLSMRWWKS